MACWDAVSVPLRLRTCPPRRSTRRRASALASSRARCCAAARWREKYTATPMTATTSPIRKIAGSMGAVTSRIGFYTAVLKLGSRNPVLLARQVASVASLTGGRFGLGLGVGWLPQEFEWCGVPFERRGKRVDEAIDVLRLILGGGMVEYHGEFYDFEKLQMSPTPPSRVPFYIGGHTDVALRRAARAGDGWSSAMMKFDDLRDTIARLRSLLAEQGRADDPFEYQAVCIDRFGLDGYREQAEIGVTDVITMPWVFEGIGFDGPLAPKLDAIRKFGDDILAKFGG